MVIRRTSPLFDCNLKLVLLKLRKETARTSHADTDESDVSLAGVLQDAELCELVAQSDSYCMRGLVAAGWQQSDCCHPAATWRDEL